jgi:hypothetical protein
MGAFVRHEFRKGFLLDEERIRKINEILNQRLTGVEGSPKPTYKVYRADAFSYTTVDVQDVINEENSEWQRITRLAVSASSGDILDLKLDFDESGTGLHIEGEDRDFVYLLFSDLRQYLSNEVNVLRSLPRRIGRLVTGIGMIIVSVIFMVEVWPAPATTVLESQDIHEKLNVLIERQTLSSPILPVLLGMLALLMIGQLLGEEKLLKMVELFFPQNIFLFGKELDRYARIQTLRNRIFWGVIVASVVGVATGLVVWLITNM